MRSKKALLNTITSLGLEIVTIISSLIVPRLILLHFGSSYNGLTSSISHFVSYLSLLTSGVGAVTTAALYKPLHEGDNEAISSIVNATEIFMRRIAFIFTVGVFVFAIAYPLVVPNDFGWLFAASLVVIISLSKIVQYFFGTAYETLIVADQRLYLITFIRIITTALNTLIAVILIYYSKSIHVIKFGSALVFMINPIFIYLYTKSHYKIDKTIKPNFIAIKQRWDAFGHQVANFINNNTDIVVLSVFTSLNEVSVYTIYYLVMNGIKMILQSFYNGINAAFGNMIARKEFGALSRNLSYFEFLMYSLSTIMYTTTAILIVPFVTLYTSGITDVNYIRPWFGYLASIGAAIYAIQTPYQSVARGAGHFRETRNASYIEAVINIVLSLVLVKKFGLIGVTIGTVIALLFRTIQYSYYVSKNIISRDFFITIRRLFLTACNVVIIVFTVKFVGLNPITNYLNWIIAGFKVFSISFLITLSFALVFYKEDFLGLIKIFNNILKK